MQENSGTLKTWIDAFKPRLRQMALTFSFEVRLTKSTFVELQIIYTFWFHFLLYFVCFFFFPLYFYLSRFFFNFKNEVERENCWNNKKKSVSKEFLIKKYEKIMKSSKVFKLFSKNEEVWKIFTEEKKILLRKKLLKQFEH